MSEEAARPVVHEEFTLEKFEGDVLIERITVVNGEITRQEVFNN